MIVTISASTPGGPWVVAPEDGSEPELVEGEAAAAAGITAMMGMDRTGRFNARRLETGWLIDSRILGASPG